jgi:hypothetical protein
MSKEITQRRECRKRGKSLAPRAKKRTKMNWACERALHAIKGKGKMCLVGLPQPTASVKTMLTTLTTSNDGVTRAHH